VHPSWIGGLVQKYRDWLARLQARNLERERQREERLQELSDLIQRAEERVDQLERDEESR
jgi:hypothetical protein